MSKLKTTGAPPPPKRTDDYDVLSEMDAIVTTPTRYTISDLADMFLCAESEIKDVIRNQKSVARDGRYLISELFMPYMDTEDLSFKDLLDFNRAKVALEDARSKSRDNEIKSRSLTPTDDVIKLMSSGFKIVADFLTKLPDDVERDGIIDPSNTQKLIDLVDKTREAMFNELIKFSKLGDDDGE